MPAVFLSAQRSRSQIVSACRVMSLVADYSDKLDYRMKLALNTRVSVSKNMHAQAWVKSNPSMNFRYPSTPHCLMPSTNHSALLYIFQLETLIPQNEQQEK